jgi:hypothetical protein
MQSQIAFARHGGSWDRSGITSSAAASHPSHATTLGILEGSSFRQIYGPGATFSGQSVDDTSVLVKYTWYGDSDFNGKVNFDDYVRTDNGFNNHLTGWLNGDFDLNGQVNFDDYVLIDLAFNTQSGTLGRALAFLDGSDLSDRGMDNAALRQVQAHVAAFGADYAGHLLAPCPSRPAVRLSWMASRLSHFTDAPMGQVDLTFGDPTPAVPRVQSFAFGEIAGDGDEAQVHRVVSFSPRSRSHATMFDRCSRQAFVGANFTGQGGATLGLEPPDTMGAPASTITFSSSMAGSAFSPRTVAADRSRR